MKHDEKCSKFSWGRSPPLLMHNPSVNKLFPPLFILVITVVIYVKTLFYSGYVEWGNSGFPLITNIFHSLDGITWDGYTFNGIPVVSPLTSLFGNLNNYLVLILGGLWNISVATKLYLILTFFFMSYAFYIFTGRFSNSIFPRVFATVFYMLNPQTLQQTGLGDSTQFLFFGVYFLSLLLLSKGVNAKTTLKLTYIFLSVILLSFTAAEPYLFYLGTALYIAFIFYFALIEHGHLSAVGAKEFLKSLSLALILLILLSTPLILTIFYGAYNLSPSSSLALPLNGFINESSSFFNLLGMRWTIPVTALLAPLKSSLITSVWLSALVILVFLILESGIIFRDKRMLFFSLLVVLASLLGSGYLSPISSFTIYLYTHFPGYQLLYLSFTWEVVVIIPLYGLIICLMMDRLMKIRIKKKGTRLSETQTRRVLEKSLKAGNYKTAIPAIAVALIILFVSISPVIGEGYYGTGNVGIHPANFPSSYSDLINQISKLVGNTGTGVAYFPLDTVYYYGNSTNMVVNPLLVNNNVTTPGLPVYESPPLESNYFAYWIYTEFYLNETHNIAQLMGLLGVKYFVTLNGVKSVQFPIFNTQNSTDLMKYQSDLKLLYSSPSYSIFESTVDVDRANTVNTFTITSGDYTALSISAAEGLDISSLTPIFVSDINSSSFDFYINKTSSIILLSSQSLTSLAIGELTNSSNSINVLDYTDNYYYGPGQGWLNSRAIETTGWPWIINEASSYAITSTNKTMSVYLKGLNNTNYSIWAYILDSPVKNSELQFTMNNESTVFNTSINNNELGYFTWIQIPLTFSSTSNVLNITSLHGTNGIERLVVLKNGSLETEENSLEDLIKSKGITIINLFSGSSPFKPNESLASAIKKINKEAVFTSPLYVINNPNGYTVYGRITNVSIVRYEYFRGMIETVPGFKVLPIMNGVSFLLVTSTTHHKAAFVSVDYGLLVDGIVIYTGTVTVVTAYLIYRKYGLKKGKYKELIKIPLKRKPT